MTLPPDLESNFRTDRYANLNQTRWDHFLSLGIPIQGKAIFEPGAGIGDQTEWLIGQGASHVWVQDGRQTNCDVIEERFRFDSRVIVLPACDLESGFIDPAEEVPFVDLIFCWGVYYHLADRPPEFPVLKMLAKMGETVVLDYLVGNDSETSYGQDNPSTSLNLRATRPRKETLLQALSDSFGYGFEPKQPLEWVDPLCGDKRLTAVGSHFLLDNPNLLRFDGSLTKMTV